MYATGFNLAVAPTFAKYGYPLFAVACVTDQAPVLIKKYPGFFLFNSSTTNYAKGAIDVLKKLKDGSQIGNKIAVVNVADDFGIELANAGRPLFKDAGFEIVYDKSYPLGTQDCTPIIKAAKAANADAFVAWSYPPDTFGLAEQAKIEGLNVKAYYSAVGTDFEGFSRKIRRSRRERPGRRGRWHSPEIRAFYKRHKEITGVDADHWGSLRNYETLQVLTNRSNPLGRWIAKVLLIMSGRTRFTTIDGEISLPGQIMDKVYTVGQWQNGYFHGVNGVNRTDFVPVKVKTGWA